MLLWKWMATDSGIGGGLASVISLVVTAVAAIMTLLWA